MNFAEAQLDFTAARSRCYGSARTLSAVDRQAGSVSAPNAFEGKAGFISAYVGDESRADELTKSLGQDWSIERVNFKPYPVCAFNQTPVKAALAMRDLLAGRVPSRIRIRMNPFETTYAGMLERGPFRSISGTLMSIPFCVAVTLLHGVPDMGAMTNFADEEVAALIPAIEVITDNSVKNLMTVIDADLADGTTISHTEYPNSDLSSNRLKTSGLVRRIGSEESLDMKLYDRLDSFVAKLPSGTIQDVIGLFPG